MLSSSYVYYWFKYYIALPYFLVFKNSIFLLFFFSVIQNWDLKSVSAFNNKKVENYLFPKFLDLFQSL